MPVSEHFAQGADLTDRLERAGLDHRQRLVQSDGLTLPELFNLDVGRTGQPHPAPGGEHVHGVVVMGVQQHPVAAGRLPQPVDLLAQHQQLLTGLLEGVHQLRIAGRQRIDPGLQLLHLAR